MSVYSKPTLTSILPSYLAIVDSHLTVRGNKLDLSWPVAMGVLNITPDSFSDGGRFIQHDKALIHIREMVNAGAAIIDVGGESTRPGSDAISVDDELARVIPVLEEALPQYPDILFSIDTTKFEVAGKALELGTHIVNDVSGLQKEPRLAELCAEYNAGLIIMHSKGDPKVMQKNPHYEDVVNEVYRFLEDKANRAQSAGVPWVIVDPGIGFGKTVDHNLQLLANLRIFRDLNRPLMIGASRKSMIGTLTGRTDPRERLAGTLAVHYDAMMQGARIIRVHDVAETVDTIRIFEAIMRRRKKDEGRSVKTEGT